MIVKIYLYLLGLFLTFLILVNSITALSSQNFYALFYPYNIKSRTEASFRLISFIIVDSGIIKLSRDRSKIEEDIKLLCLKHNMDYEFIYKIIKLKSNFNPYKIALDGSVGLLSLPLEKLKEFNCKNPFNYKEYLDRSLDIINTYLEYERSSNVSASHIKHVESVIKANSNSNSIEPNKIPLIYDQLLNKQLTIR